MKDIRDLIHKAKVEASGGKSSLEQMTANHFTLLNRIEEITGIATAREYTANSSANESQEYGKIPMSTSSNGAHSFGKTEKSCLGLNTMIKFNDPVVDLTQAEQKMLSCILQGAKINRLVSNFRGGSKIRSKSKVKRRYRKNNQANMTVSGIDVYKDRFDEEAKIDYTAVKSVGPLATFV